MTTPKESERDTELSQAAKCGFSQDSEVVTAAQSPVVKGKVGGGQEAKFLSFSKELDFSKRQKGITGTHFENIRQEKDPGNSSSVMALSGLLKPLWVKIPGLGFSFAGDNCLKCSTYKLLLRFMDYIIILYKFLLRKWAPCLHSSW